MNMQHAMEFLFLFLVVLAFVLFLSLIQVFRAKARMVDPDCIVFMDVGKKKNSFELELYGILRKLQRFHQYKVVLYTKEPLDTVSKQVVERVLEEYPEEVEFLEEEASRAYKNSLLYEDNIVIWEVGKSHESRMKWMDCMFL